MTWLRCPAYRRVLLEPAFRVIGIGIVSGTPTAGTTGERTYTTDFDS